jgi:hypothetical protein
MASIRVMYTGKASINVVLDCALYAQKDRDLAKFWRDMAASALDDTTRMRRIREACKIERMAAQWRERATRYAAGQPVTYRQPRKAVSQ